MIKKELIKAEMKYNVLRDRAISIRLWGTFINTAVIQVYAPTPDSEEEELDQFYEQVQAEIDQACKQDVVIVMGDWNAKVGENEEGQVVGK